MTRANTSAAAELVATNPSHPAWGRVVIDRDGLMEWDYWGHIADAGAADLAAVIVAIMATRRAYFCTARR